MGTIKKGRFVIGTHIFRPAPGARTEQKGYEQGILEDVEYVEKLKDKHMDTSTYVLNLDTLQFEKNRVDEFTVQVCLAHLQKHFPNDYSQWMKKTSAEVQKKVNDEDKSN